MEKTYTLKIGEDNLVFKTGKVAKQANAAVVAVHGETTVLTTACMSDKPREGLDFFPLLVDFEERYYAAGKIPGGYIKREGRPSQKAILSARVIDRSIRSLFDENMRNDVHVVATVLSVDQEHPSSILGINAASLALTISDIPWSGPVGAVRMGCIDGRLVVNPAEGQMENSTLDLTVAGHAGGITMVEAGAKEVSEELMVDALQRAQEEIKKIVAFQLQVREEIGLDKAVLPLPPAFPEIDQWAFMQPVALNTISPDTGLNIKGVTDDLPSYSYTYTEPGTYTVTFIVAGGNYQGQSAPAPYEVTFTVIDPIE